ncbi:glycerophosphodiester phosphodiesterase family protein [Hafnia alvei]|uniref:tail fiber/spike domain-containing protein n=1 Tax=Hafnia alvei TaxID=569 RepID=UPI000E0715F4|nr:glycerophosphodiester phosphodiesterase family protein [Hafnia alvei]STQ70192.1 Glycerophosphoryl diester phosphodiesterase family [Hafnia alvei]
MATQPTNLPVPSESARDLKFNAGKIDEFVTSASHEYIDRFGGRHRTIAGINYESNQAMSNYGYITQKSFEMGSTLNTPNTVLQWESNGEFYRWDGDWSQPKVVPAGSTPDSTGGIGEGKWVGVGDASLRRDLSSSLDGNGDNLVMHGSKTVNQVINDALNSIDKIKYFTTFGNHLTSLHGAGKSLGAENSLITATLLSKRNAVIDVDISTTKDNIAVCLHNLNIDGILSGTGSIFDYTFSQIRTMFRVLAFDGTPYQGTRLTSWDEMVKSCARRGNLLTAELKNTKDNSDAMNSIYASIASYHMVGRVILQCLNIYRLQDYRRHTGDNKSPLQLLIYDGMPNENLVDVINDVLNIDGLGLNIDIGYTKLTEVVGLANQYDIQYSFYTATNKTKELDARLVSTSTQITRDYTE